MSKIVRATVNVDMKERGVLEKALRHFGRVTEDGRGGFRLSSKELRMRDMSFEQHSNGQGGFMVRYDEDDRNAINLLRQIEDRYIAHHYEKELVSEGFEVQINAVANGSLELIANEAEW